jgi:uncharacterized protein YbaR (Trm112 family)
MSLLDVLACPCCKQGLTRSAAALRCAGCGREYPVVDGVPVLLPPGITPQVSLPGELEVFGGYEPFVQQLLDSLPPDEPILDIGAGNRSVSDPRIVRMEARSSESCLTTRFCCSRLASTALAVLLFATFKALSSASSC